jgi:hypothetical protein
MASETDKIVREIDVYSCRNLWGNTTQVLPLLTNFDMQPCGSYYLV